VEMEGYKPARFPEGVYEQLRAESEEGKQHPGVAQKPKGTGPNGCTKVIIVYPGGDNNETCGGGCGFVDRFFGRSCTRQITGNPDGSDLEVSCSCSGGWFDRIFG
jgi:hypothetical protein